MTSEEMKEFSLRITQSNKSEIVVITYEIILNYIDSAKKCFADNNMQDMVKNLKKAQQFINDLASNLDLNYEISLELMNIYRYSNKVIWNGIVKQKLDNIEAVEKMMNQLKDSFLEVAKNDKRGSAMNVGNQVYAGLTYGNNRKLNECVMPLTK